MYPTASYADESPEIRTHILRSQAVAVDAPPVGRKLEKPPDDLLVPLLLLPAAHPTKSRVFDRNLGF